MIGKISRAWRLAAMLALATCVWFLPTAHAAGCDGIADYQPVVSGAASSAHQVVPLVIHIMERPGHTCEVRNSWTAKQVATVFGPDTGDDKSVSSVWGGTHIRFEIREIHVHEFEPPAALVDSQQRIKVPTTSAVGDQAYEAAFAKVETFHRDGSVDIYLWRRLGGQPIGFGRSTRSGNGKASIFLDVRCGQQSLRTCATLASHELGHTMGLYHAGANTCGAVQPKFHDLCVTLAAPCAEVKTAQRLMTLGASGRGLCPKEADEAKDQAGKDFK